MKKTARILFLAAAVLLILFAAAGCKKEPEQENTADIPNVYNNYDDFSTLHGYMGWYYMFGNLSDSEADSTLSKMVFDLDIGRWNGKDFYVFIEKNQMHPGNNSEVILGWKAPKSGSITLDCTVTHCPTDPTAVTADGVLFYVQKGFSDEYVMSKQIARDDVEEHKMSDNLTVKKDEMIFFVINAAGNNSYDNTRVLANIEYSA